MKRFALTGGIASGKSTVSRYLERLKIPLVDCDALVSSAYSMNEPIYEAIVSGFGSEILNEDGTINRKHLGHIIFNDPLQREKLNGLTHPIIKNMIDASCIKLEVQGHPFAFVDIPLLFETGQEIYYDAVLLIDIDPEIQLMRLKERNGWTTEEAQARIDAQLSMAYKRSLADWIIDNNGTEDELCEQIDALLDYIEHFKV